MCVCVYRTRLSRRMFGAAPSGLVQTPCGCCAGMLVLGRLISFKWHACMCLASAFALRFYLNFRCTAGPRWGLGPGQIFGYVFSFRPRRPGKPAGDLIGIYNIYGFALKCAILLFVMF